MFNSSIFFLAGLIIGSFLNVISLRYQEGGPLLPRSLFFGRSHCPYCDKTLRWYELVPVFSFLVQRGRCRSCSHPLSWQYPIIETLSGLFLAAAIYHLGGKFNELELVILILAGLTLILIAAIDFRLMIIPDQLNWFLAILGAGRLFINGQWQDHILAAVIGTAVFLAIVLVTRGKAMGVGDVKLAGALGLLLGLSGILVTIFLSFVIGAAWGIGLLITRKKTMQDLIPFGPFLAAGAILTILFGEVITYNYLNLLNV